MAALLEGKKKDNGVKEIMKIKDIRLDQDIVNVVFIVLEADPPSVTKNNRDVRNFKVADSTACMDVSIWDQPGKLVEPGDVIKLTNVFATLCNQCLTLNSDISEDVQKIGEFCIDFSEQLNMSEPNPNLLKQLTQGSGNNNAVNNGNYNNAAPPAKYSSIHQKFLDSPHEN